MTRPDLDALAALLDKATPGPWRDSAASVTPTHGLFTETKQENSALIVAAVNALPALIARVRELERERDEAREGWHMANGVADLAVKHRDCAEAERDALRECLKSVVSAWDDDYKPTWYERWQPAIDAARAKVEVKS